MRRLKYHIAGPLPGARMMEIFSAYIGDFFKVVLKGEDVLHLR